MSNIVESHLPAPQSHRPKTGETLRAPNLAATYDTVLDLSAARGRGGQDENDGWTNGAIMLLGVNALGVPGDGTVQCQSLDDAQGTPQSYTVLLPPTFYETVRGTVSYVYTSTNSRTATEGPDNESQLLTPEIAIGDVLMCIYNRGVWQDLNTDGRQWAADV